MKETIEIRIPEESARAFLESNEGRCLGGSVRRIELDLCDVRLQRIGEINDEFRSRGSAFVVAWIPHRRYEKNELDGAEMFHLIPKRIFEPAGEECGTQYDESAACILCGSGATQVSPLFLDANSLPKKGNLAIAKSIAEEMVVSARFAELFKANKLDGAEFRFVGRRSRPTVPIEGWFQLDVIAERVAIVPPTRIGENPFNECVKGRYSCPFGHVLGLNLLSELWVSRSDVRNKDIVYTKQYVGVRRGLLRPKAPLLVSPRLWRALEQSGLRGYKVEVVHLT